MKIFVLFSTFILSASVLYGCIWIDGTTIDGQSISHSGMSPSVAEVFESFELSPSEKLNSVISKRPANPDQEWKAVEAMFSNKPQETIQILSPLFESAPSYSIAANLGTAYELNGQNELALKWIARGIELNPDSHFGTEWLHSKILKTKIILSTEANTLKKNRIIPLPSKFSLDTKMEVSGKNYSIGKIQKSILYQLKERLVFVKPPDPIVADLLYTLAVIEANISTLEPSLKLLKLSKEYGFQNNAVIDGTISEFENLILYRKLKSNTGIGLIIFLFILILYYLHKKKIFFISRVTYKASLKKKNSP